MGTATCYSAHLVGLNAEIITVEVDISHGLNAVSIVGLGDRAVEEAKDRISAAIKNTGYISPKQKNQKTVISLAPADIRKEGPSFDLAMALSYLKASGEVDTDFECILFLGELSLEGKMRRVAGILPILCQAGKNGWKRAIIPAENAKEAAIASGIEVFAINSLQECLDFISGKTKIEPVKRFEYTPESELTETITPDMSSIRGNEAAKRGLEIAAAGGHNVLMFGPPGTGKTMLAQSFATILPPLSQEECIEVTGIHSAARVLETGLITRPPFRSPHHTASYPAIVGGGSFPKPGEITLAHRGVLFLDEFPEFDRSVLEALRQPLEERLITISRAKGTITYPAQSILIASMNPCPCGKPKGKGCICPPHTIKMYRRRVSGPILDRIDIWINVSKVDYEKLSAEKHTSETSETIKKRVVEARRLQHARFEVRGIHKSKNTEMSVEDIQLLCPMTGDARQKLKMAAEKLNLSGRAFHRVIKVARTIADLAKREFIEERDILEALQYRQKMEDY